MTNRFPRPAAGMPQVGHIAQLSTGQCHGTIRMANGREVWFHRSDVRDCTRFNELFVGDSVAFELLEDRISGARALRVGGIRQPRAASPARTAPVTPQTIGPR